MTKKILIIDDDDDIREATHDGMVEALKKSNQVAEILKNLTSEVEFWDWYDKEIKQN